MKKSPQNKFFIPIVILLLLAVFVVGFLSGSYVMYRGTTNTMSTSQLKFPLMNAPVSQSDSFDPNANAPKITQSGCLNEDNGWCSLTIQKKDDNPNHYGFKLNYPKDWLMELKETKIPSEYFITLTKGKITLDIWRGTGGYGICTYPGEPVPEMMGSSYISYKEFTKNARIVWRVSEHEHNKYEISKRFTVCSNQGDDEFYGITEIGWIGIDDPSKVYDPKLVSEASQIIDKIELLK